MAGFRGGRQCDATLVRPNGVDPEDRFIVDDLKCETGLEGSLNDCAFKGDENCGASEGVWVACDSAPCGEPLTPVTGLRLVNTEATLVGPQYAASGGVTAAWSAFTGPDRQIFMPASGVLQVPTAAEPLAGARLGLGRVAAFGRVAALPRHTGLQLYAPRYSAPLFLRRRCGPNPASRCRWTGTRPGATSATTRSTRTTTPRGSSAGCSARPAASPATRASSR